MSKRKLIRATTVPMSLNAFCCGMLTELSADYEVVALSSAGPEWNEIGAREGVKCIQVPMERHIAPMKDLIALVRLWWVFMKERPRMVHSMTPKAGLLCMMAAFFAGVPRRVHTFTGLVFPTATGMTRKILMFTDWLTCACATHIIPEGEGVKNDLQNNGITKKPLQVLGYGNVRGIDLNKYCRSDEVIAVANKLRKNDVFTFVFVGRLVGDKGVNELVQAFVRLNKEWRQTRLVLVGPEEKSLDPLKPETEKLIAEDVSIESVGLQEDIRPWLAMSDAAILPSYREGFPNVVIEAGAMGLPQIVTDINGSREIIVEGKNGTIVPPRDVDALYQAMRKYVESPNFVAMLAANARQMIASRYEQSFVRSCLYEFYKEIM